MTEETEQPKDDSINKEKLVKALEDIAGLLVDIELRMDFLEDRLNAHENVHTQQARLFLAKKKVRPKDSDLRITFDI